MNYLARCEQAFRPYAPIDLPEFFAGRIKHIERLQAEVNAPGRHVAVFGERGVGKTSLAQLTCFFLDREEDRTHFVRCEKTSTFDTIFSDVLASAGIEVVLNGIESEGERHGSLAVAFLGAGGSRRVRRTFRRISAGRQISPRFLLEQFGAHEGLIIIDEYDRITDPATHTRMAELIKHFSDANSNTKIILVGVAETLTQLIGEHESLGRSLAQIKLDRMPKEELEDILKRGETHIDAVFKSAIKRRIIGLADGFPYFVHLISRHAARIAGREWARYPASKTVVADEEYAVGLQEALDNAERSLVEQYDQAVVTTRRPSDKFRLVLWGMGLSEARDVQVQEIARNASLFAGPVQAASFSSALKNLISAARGNVLTKVREGYYKFTNPLMRPYVRSIMELENVLRRDRQWELPFMD